MVRFTTASSIASARSLRPTSFLNGEWLARTKNPLPAIVSNEALTFERGIGLGDRVPIDFERFREWSDRRQPLSRPGDAARGGEPHLVDDLQIDRLAWLEIELEEHHNCLVTVGQIVRSFKHLEKLSTRRPFVQPVLI